MAPVFSSPNRARSAFPLVLGFAIVVLGASLRLPAVRAGLPYSTYVDEGHALRAGSVLFKNGGWELHWYVYPSLPLYLINLADHAIDPLYQRSHQRPLRDDILIAPGHYFDVIQPAELFIAGRLVTLGFSLGIIVMAGLLGASAAGPPAGLLAALLAAVLPALVMRGGIIIVDTYAAFFVLASLYFASRLEIGAHRAGLNAVLAGAAAGLAFTSKYQAGAVGIALVLGILISAGGVRRKMRLLLLAGLAGATAAVLSMPALVLRTRDVFQSFAYVTRIYANQQQGSYWLQAVQRAEWDLPLEQPELGILFVILAVAGLGVALAQRRTARMAATWAVYSVITLIVAYRFPYQPFRNILPLGALACVWIGVLYAALRARLPGRRWPDLLAVGLVMAIYAVPVADYVSHQVGLVDSRVEAVDWLQTNTDAKAEVLVLQDLAMLPVELERIPGLVYVRPWAESRAMIDAGTADVLVLGDIQNKPRQPSISSEVWNQIKQDYVLAAQFGNTPTPHVPERWRGNHQAIYILTKRQ